MLEYIYFVKCPGCEDEHFSFFNEAKEFAMSLLSKKPIITQIEVDRNDFGECTNSCDLGTVWSWEDMMQDVSAEPTATSFSKADTIDCDNCFDQEFDSLDNSLDSVPDNFRKPVPADMSVDALIEEMEENEDTVECKWCNELFDKSECRKEVDLGWLCDNCQQAIKSRGETLTFTESPLAESGDQATEYAWKKTPVELEYKSLEVTLQGPEQNTTPVYRSPEWFEPTWREEKDVKVDYTYEADPISVSEEIWELMTDEDVAAVPGGFDALYADNDLFDRFMEENFDKLVTKYMPQLLVKFESTAREFYEETHSLDEGCDSKKVALAETMDPREMVELEYDSLTIPVYSAKYDVDDWDEFEHTDSFVYLVPKVEVATVIWDNFLTEEDVAEVPGGMEALENDTAWEQFLETNFDNLFEKYNKQILDYFKAEATEDFRERYQTEYQMNKLADAQDRAYDEWRDERYFGESKESKPFLEELDDAETHKARLTDCPECGSVSYDMKEQYCTNCGLNL